VKRSGDAVPQFSSTRGYWGFARGGLLGFESGRWAYSPRRELLHLFHASARMSRSAALQNVLDHSTETIET
jgi:hypothetical protein